MLKIEYVTFVTYDTNVQKEKRKTHLSGKTPTFKKNEMDEVSVLNAL